MFDVAKVAGYLLSPLTVVLGLGLLAGLCLLLRRRKLARTLAVMSFVTLWIASTPALGLWLTSRLEAQYPALTVEQTPQADAILVLGGALAGASPPRRPTANLGPAAGRVWHTAALYRAGKATWVVIAGGNQPGHEHEQAEGDAIAEMLLVLGVPRSAIRLETGSRNTRENAQNALVLLDALKARRVLLVTSAQHMPRAVKTFARTWAGSAIQLIPASTDVQVTELTYSPKLWFPSLGALISVSKAVKEIAGSVALDIM
jgi:uncharacterized SAM-binding protein YcdF (DUF218 family)